MLVRSSELGALCVERGVRCLHVSTDYVFDGLASRPYQRGRPSHANQYLWKDEAISVKNFCYESSADHLVIRVSWVFGPDKPGFVDLLLDRAIEPGRSCQPLTTSFPHQLTR